MEALSKVDGGVDRRIGTVVEGPDVTVVSEKDWEAGLMAVVSQKEFTG